MKSYAKKKWLGIVMLFCLTVFAVCISSGGVGAAKSYSPLKVKYLNCEYESDGRIFMNVEVTNGTTQRRIISRLKGRAWLTIGNNGKEYKIFNSKDNWSVNMCILPKQTRVLRLFVGHADAQKLNEMFADKEAKAAIEKRTAKLNSGIDIKEITDYASTKPYHIKVSGYEWDAVRQGIVLTMDVCNDSYESLMVSGVSVNLEIKDKLVGLLKTNRDYHFNNLDLVVPPYTQLQQELFIPGISNNGKYQGKLPIKIGYNTRQHYIKENSTEYEEEYESAEEDYADEYEDAAGNKTTETAQSAVPAAKDDFEEVSSSADGGFEEVKSSNNNDEFEEVASS